MDFFAKAHVSKKKNSKSEELVKKNLKAMLQGYKRSDNELIKKSASGDNDIYTRYDDAHVSDVEEIVISESEDEASQSQASEADRTSVDKKSISDEESNDSTDTESEDEESHKSNASDKSNDEVVVRESLSNESISECDEEIESLSDEAESVASDTSEEIPILINADESTTASTDSEEFDPQGILASKILERLGKAKEKSSQKGKKRKLDHDPKERKSKKNHVETKQTVENENVAAMNALSIVATDDEDTTSTTESAPYVSISVQEMPDQSLSDVLGDYVHSTVKNVHDVQPGHSNSTFMNSYNEFENIAPCSVPRVLKRAGQIQYNVKNPQNEQEVVEVEEQDENTNNQVQGGEQCEYTGDRAQEDEQCENATAQVVESQDEYESVHVDDDVQSENATDSVQATEESEDENEFDPFSSSFENRPFVCPVKVYYVRNGYICMLRHPTNLFINGKVRVKLLVGPIEVHGYRMKIGQKLRLYAPNNSHSMCLSTVADETNYYGLFHRLTTEGLSVTEAEDIVTSLGPQDGVIVLRMLVENSIDFVQKYVNTELSLKSLKTVESILKPISIDLECNFYVTQPWRYFETGAEWETAVEYGLPERSRGVICGGKGLGKSTFLRYYVNQMLQDGPILVIDLDPGQCEFTPAGMVSATVVTTPLLGPNYTHIKNPDITYYIGMINPMDNSTRYANAVTEVLVGCHARYSSLRWVVNTMGMCNYMGLRFLIHAILHTQPSFVMQIDSKIPKKRFEYHLTASKVQELYENWKHIKILRCCAAPTLRYDFVHAAAMEGCHKHNTSRSPKDDRFLNYLAYFGKLMNGNSGARSLLQILPYQVNLSDLQVMTNVKVTGDILKIINGKIVALCRTDDLEKGTVSTLADTPLLCFGHGLVRSVSFAERKVFLVTPTHNLQPVNCLVYSDWAPDMCAPDPALPAGVPVPYVATPHQQQKQLMNPPRRRFNPLQLLKMSRMA
ncbi:unnamed protein product [Chrysodeixis includens]|uniref:Polynucleotide 5'-hydroxyl-kinase NOL9 n=1 Tax=Chrysodeixis includens TaxID=689277 RepID=A0A9N8PZ91_CHRIL|nr:unnamed protein product [Chrysodeixis includens]